jgi:hypothetical protein
MRTRHPVLLALAAGGMLIASGMQSDATEYAFSTYGLGGAAFGAGVTPPPGTYVTEATSFYSANIGATVSFGGITLNPGARVAPSPPRPTFCMCPSERRSAATWDWR